MTSKTTSRKLTQKTIQSTPTPANANQLAPTSANANAPTDENSTTETFQMTGKQLEESSITVQALKNELNSFREVLSSDIKIQIETMRGELSRDIATLQQKAQDDIKALRDELFSQMRSLVDSHNETMQTQQEIEKSLTDVGDRVTILEKNNDRLNKEYKKVLEKCMDLENRSRRQNIRIIGIDENSEKGNPTRFVGELLVEILGRENFSSPLIIDRAHRTLAPKPRPGERPRALLARVHYYTDKEKILRLSREKGRLQYKGSQVHIFPDMSPEVVRLRASFKQIKAKLRASDIPYSLYYPARLEVTSKGTRHVFTDPQEAEKFFVGIGSTDEET